MPTSAMRYVKARFPNDRDRTPLVVKADGLASGKGVIVCSRRDEVMEAIDRIGRKNEFGRAGAQMVIEERLEGPEVSVLAITDGRTIVTLPPAQDHKAAYDGDTGPNTGGMGAYSPNSCHERGVNGDDRRQDLGPVYPCHETEPQAISVESSTRG
jgi:phosphoribosylamine---glycine ligase